MQDVSARKIHAMIAEKDWDEKMDREDLRF